MSIRNTGTSLTAYRRRGRGVHMSIESTKLFNVFYANQKNKKGENAYPDI